MNNDMGTLTNLIHRHLDILDNYHSNVHEAMTGINTCIQELLQIQGGRDRDARLFRRRATTNPFYIRTPQNLNRTNRTNSVSRGDAGRYQDSVRTRRDGLNNMRRRTGVPSLRTGNDLNRDRNRNIEHTNRQNSRRGTRIQPRRRMTLQEFINTTLNQGNPRIPAEHNDIMRQTSIVSFQDLSGTDNLVCPISLTTFDASSNILRINHCNHVFEARSLMRWFREDSRCPLCRYNINSDRDIHRRDETASTQTDITTNVDEDEDTNSNAYPSINTSIPDLLTPNIPSGSGTIIYDISFSIPQLFGRDVSDNEINNVIDNITNTITASMNNTLSQYRQQTNDDSEIIISSTNREEEHGNSSALGPMEDDYSSDSELDTIVNELDL